MQNQLGFGVPALALLALATAPACGGDGAAAASTGSATAQPPASSADGSSQTSARAVPTGGAGMSTAATSIPTGAAGSHAGATAPGAKTTGSGGGSAMSAAAGAGAGASGSGVGGSSGAMSMMDAAGASGGAATAKSGASDAADPSPGCTDGKLAPGESMQMFESGGTSRVYVQHIPDSYDGKTPMPVVLDLHGGSYDGPRWVDVSGFKKLGDSEGFITLFPSGTDNSWLATDKDSADGQFLKELIAEIGKQGCIDRKRVYATGCSMGGAMSFWMGCFASDLIAAIAPMCGTPFFELMECKPMRPIAMMLTIGETDNLNCWQGARQGIGNPCAMEVFDYFRGLDMCTGDSQDTHDGVCKTYDQCALGTEVTVCKSNTGHGVYTATNIDVTGESWKFLKRFWLQ